MPMAWLYLHPFAEEFLAEQFAVGYPHLVHVIMPSHPNFLFYSPLLAMCAFGGELPVLYF